jgi:hypothetical protein
MRALFVTALFAAAATPLLAQDLERPTGWKVRFDRPTTHDSTLRFVDMPPGWHITTGPAAIFYDPARVAAGTYRVSSETYLFPGERREAFGVFIGGQDLETPNQRYVYFLIRKDGRFLIKQRRGSSASELQGWTEHSAIVKHDGGEGTAKNVLGIDVTSDTVTFLVNGATVARLPREGLTTDGIVGLRVNHALNIHVTTLDVEATGG